MNSHDLNLKGIHLMSQGNFQSFLLFHYIKSQMGQKMSLKQK